MAEREPRTEWFEDGLTRRQVVRGAMAGGVAMSSAGLLAACGSDDDDGGGGGSTTDTRTETEGGIKQGGTLRVGATGGGAEDTLDAHKPTSDPDIMRVWQLYEPLAVRPADFGDLEMLLAESIEAEKADLWTIRLKEGVEFHNGKPVTADDVIFSIKRILDPKDPKVGTASISYIDVKGLKKVDDRTVEIPLQFANATFPEDIGQYFNGIVPVDYDPENPVGTGAFKYESIQPGEQSTFLRHENYWRENEPYADELVIIDFTEDTAKVNALLGGQVEAVNNLPFSQLTNVQGNPQFKVVISETGSWQPFTMRVDQAPFSDNRVREAFRWIVDRQQMVDQVLSGQGRVANDLYAPFDPCYASDLPQREQDLEKAKSLLQQAGQSDLRVELVTAPVFRGIVEAAQVFAEQAKGAGVTVNVRKVDSGTFYADNYLKWTFAQDFWSTRLYLTQVAQGSLPNSPFNETHWDDKEFQQLIREARGELDDDRRCELLHEAQQLEYDKGGYIIPYFSNAIDAHSAKVTGIVPAKSGFTLGNYGLRSVGFTA
jgi:peptide/nickel transport system substrate-binding protein